MTIHRILFPIDFSEHSRAVAPFVHSLAHRHGAQVILINIIQTPLPLYGGFSSNSGLVPIPDTFDYEAVRADTLQNLNEFGAAELPKLEILSFADFGDPALLIAAYAAENGIDLICMSTQGHGAFRRILLGSVAAKVLHDTKIPVWMDAHAPEASHRAHPQPRHILVAIETEEGARQTLDAAASIAKETGATLEIVTAVAEGIIARSLSDKDLDDLLIAGTRELLAKLQYETGSQFGTVIGVGTPADVVRATALDKRADLVICGRSTPHGLLSRLNDNSYAIIREAPCPVISI